MRKLLHSLSNWKFILPLFIAFCVFTFYLFPQYQSHLNELAGKELSILDTRMSYSAQEVKQLFDDLGASGREEYSHVAGVIDMIYPLVYGLLFILVLAYLFKKITKKPAIIFLSLLPLIGMCFDYLENFNTLNLLNLYPDIEENIVKRGELMTRLKHGFLVLSLLLIVFSGLTLLMQKIKKRPAGLVK